MADHPQHPTLPHEFYMLIGELKANQTALNQIMIADKAKLAELEKTVNEINSKINKAAGAIAVATVLVSAVIQFIVAKFKGA